MSGTCLYFTPQTRAFSVMIDSFTNNVRNVDDNPRSGSGILGINFYHVVSLYACEHIVEHYFANNNVQILSFPLSVKHV